MTALPATLPDLAALTQDDPRDLSRLPRPVRAAAVDSLIHEQRKQTPQAVVEQRRAPRLSVAELNAQSMDQVRAHFARTRIDDRGPVTRFLDILDLPRNVVATILAPSIARRKREEGETGAFGMGVVRTADILDDLGVENRVARGIIGFVGDVALDPLTYAGPPGWGAKAAGTAGRAVRFTHSGLKNLRKGAKAGFEAADETGAYFRAVKGLSEAQPDAVAKYGLDLTTEQGRMASMLGNTVKPTTIGGKAKAEALRFAGGDITGESSLLADLVERAIITPEAAAKLGKAATTEAEKAAINAAKALVRKQSRSGAPGLRFGTEGGKLGVEFTGGLKSRGAGRFDAGSTVMHIPFTDWGIHVPAFTQEARAGIMTAGLAKNLYASGKELSGVRTKTIADGLAGVVRETGFGRTATQRAGELEQLAAKGRVSGVYPGFTAAHEAEIKSLRDAATESAANAKAHFETVRAAALELDADKFADMGEVAYAGEALRAAKAELDATLAEADTLAALASGQMGDFAPMKKALDERITERMAGERRSFQIEELWRKTGHILDEKQRRAEFRMLLNEWKQTQNAADLDDRVMEQIAEDFMGAVDEVGDSRLGQEFVTDRNTDDPSWQFVSPDNTDEMQRLARENIVHPQDVDDGMGVPEIVQRLRERRRRSPHPVYNDPEPLPPDKIPFTPSQMDEDAARARIAQEEYAKYWNELDEKNRRVFEMDENAIAARAAFADNLHTLAKSREMLAGTLHGSLANTMSDRALRDTAGAMIGLSPDYSGYTPLASIDSIMEAIDEADTKKVLSGMVRAVKTGNQHAAHRIGRWFGLKDPSDLSRVIRALHRVKVNAAEGMTARYVNEFMKEARTIGDKYGFSREQASSLYGVFKAAGGWPIEGSAEWKVLDRSFAKGYMQNKELVEDLKVLADKWAGFWADRLGEDQLIQAMGKGQDPARYWPTYMSKAGQQAAARQKQNIWITGASGEGVARAEAARQNFAQQRGMVEYKFTIKDGASEKEYRFMGSDRDVLAAIDDKSFDLLTKEAQAQVTAKRAAIKAYDDLPPHLRQPGRPISEMEANQIAADGGFPFLFGGALSNAFVDPAVSLGMRMHQAEQARLANDAMSIVETVALPVTKLRLNEAQTKMVNGVGEFRTDNGVKGRLSYRTLPGMKAQALVLEFGDQLYRMPQVPTNVETGWNPITDIYGAEKLLTSFVPDRVALEIERISGALDTPEKVGEAMRAMEQITKMWKAVTLLHPSWTINDVISTFVLALSAGISPAAMVRHFMAALKINHLWRKGDLKALEEMKVLGRAASEHVKVGPVIGAGMFQEAMTTVTSDGTVLSPVINRIWDKRFIQDKGYRKAAIGEIGERARARVMAAQQQNPMYQKPMMEKALLAKNLIVDEVLQDRVWKPWVWANSFANDTIRTAAYLAAVEAGRHPEDAARFIGEKLLDMHTYTGFDKKMKRLIPFWSWMRASGAFGFRQLMENPKFFTMAPHLKRAIEEAVNGEARIPEHQRPRWMRDQLALQLGTDDNKRMLLMGQMVPAEAATYFATALGAPALGWEAMQDAAGYFANSISPVWKFIPELGAGREWYTKRTIGTYGDLSTPEYLLSQVRPLRELGLTGGDRKGGLMKAAERGPLDLASRLLVGGKLQPGSQDFLDVQVQRETDEVEKGLRRKIAVAEREGKDSLKYRVQLLKLFERREQKGVGRENPRWGQDTLESLKSV